MPARLSDHRRALALGAMALSLAACAPTNDSEQAPVAAPPPSSSPTTTTLPNTPTVAPTSARVEPQDRARTAVLTNRDLGPTWQSEAVSVEDDIFGGQDQRTDDPDCDRNQMEPLRAAGPAASAASEWFFTNDNASETVRSMAFVYSDVETARTALIAYQERAAQCRSWGSGGVEGSAYAFTMEQVTFEAAIGEDSFGIQHSASVPEFPEVPPCTSYAVASRTAEVVQLTAFTSTLPGAPGMSAVLKHAEAAASRIVD